MRHELGFYFWIHLIVILFMWTSPLFLNWKIILALIVLYYIQLYVYGDYILIKKQFKHKSRDMTIYIQILENFNFNVNRKKMVFLSDYVFPWIILGIAILRQIVLK